MPTLLFNDMGIYDLFPSNKISFNSILKLIKKQTNILYYDFKVILAPSPNFYAFMTIRDEI